MRKGSKYVFFKRFHEIVLMYSYNLSITGWVPNLRESFHGRCVKLDILSLPGKGSCSCRTPWSAHPTVDRVWPFLVVETPTNQHSLAEDGDCGRDGLVKHIQVLGEQAWLRGKSKNPFQEGRICEVWRRTHEETLLSWVAVMDYFYEYISTSLWYPWNIHIHNILV
jgi:hypothetical protein